MPIRHTRHPMSQINPFGGYAAGGTGALRQQAADRDRQVHRARQKSRNSGLEGDESEPQVDNAEALTAISDGEESPHQRKRRQREGNRPSADTDETHPHLDVRG